MIFLYRSAEVAELKYHHLRMEVVYLGHKNKKSLIKQVQDKLVGKMAVGESKHQDKAKGVTGEKIYSFGTLNAYLQQCCDFVKFAKAEHQAKTVDDCRPYVNEYLQRCIDQGKSSYTIKLTASALAKLYDCSSTNFIATPSRCRDDITRSRGSAVRDAHFSETKNKDLVDFCCATGLRRHELASLTGTCLKNDGNGNYSIYVKSGKGGRSRNAPVTGTREQIQKVISLCTEAGEGKVFNKIHNGADIHHYRAIYAERVYQHHARPLNSLQGSERYYCRGSKQGTIYDREALRATSQALGHNRVSVVAEHYLYCLS